jgi:(1->4)-alpha-D-glucan 1-alpha-D-glucosylmutase
VQLHAHFTFDDAAAIVPYLAELGISHLYCSPYLQAATGSMHGYDVVDHGRLNDELGGRAGFDRMLAACRAAGLGIILDVVPNHAAVGAPGEHQSRNEAWWSVLRDGPMSPYASWFDIEWDSPDNPDKILVPILGKPLADSLDELQLHDDRISYYDHEVPLAPGSLVPGDLLATLDKQHYRLSHWRVGGEELNYRRFFDVTTLAGLRVEDPDVYAASHRLLLDQVRAGELDGLRIDHPDGLADPGGYLHRLANDTRGSWIVVEKILEHGEQLPADWSCAGTTGYDALNRVTGLFVDPAGEADLTRLYTELTRSPEWDEVVRASKDIVLDRVLVPEVNKLHRLVVHAAWDSRAGRDLTARGLREALVALLIGFDVYRAYVPAAGPPDAAATATVDRARQAAYTLAPERRAEIDKVADLALTGPAELRIRFQQTCGPVMAKGVEDTAFYRYHRLIALNEVGGDPGRFGTSVQEFHDDCVTAAREWPVSMTTLSTHDTKRSEDARARLVLLSQDPVGWASACSELLALGEHHLDRAGPDRNILYLLMQTLVGVWPAAPDRIVAYMEKASREAKQHTSWTDPVPEYDEAVVRYVRGVLADDAFLGRLEAYVDTLRDAAAVTSRAQKLVQLTMPGVPDIYQGAEAEVLSLVDPDNRRPVDYEALRSSLWDNDDRKQSLVASVLRLRRQYPEWFGVGGGYEPLAAPEGIVAFARSGQLLTVVPRFAWKVARHGWGEQHLTLPSGRWRDSFSGALHEGEVRIPDLLSGAMGVAMLRRADGSVTSGPSS